MNYIDRYIHAVVKYLPEKDRLEVRDELKANIYDMLGHDHSEENIIRTLEEMGSPFKLALSYMGTEHYIIGPKVYHLYLEVLKIVAMAAVIIGVIIFALELVTGIGDMTSIGDIVRIIVSGFTTVFSVLMGFVFWVTVVFVIIERADGADEMLHSLDKPFKVTSLKEIPDLEKKKISKVEMVISMILTIVFLYLFVYRNEIIAVYTRSETIRIFHGDVILRYKFLLLFSGVVSILVSLLKLIYGRWNELLGVASAVDALVNLGVSVLVVTSGNLFTGEFIRFMEEMLERTGTGFLFDMERAIRIFIAVVLFATLMEIGTSLHNGFRKVKSVKR